MTFHEPPDGPGPSLFDGELDPFDPVIAERFKVLERATPPELPTMLAHDRPPSRSGSPPPDRVPFYLLAAAACITLIAGAAVLLTANRSPEPDVTATDRSGSRIQADAQDLEADRSSSDAIRRTDGDGELVEVPTSSDGAEPSEGAGSPAADGSTVAPPTSNSTPTTVPASSTAPPPSGPSTSEAPEPSVPLETLPPETKPVDPQDPPITIEPDPVPSPVPTAPAPTIAPPPSIGGEALVEIRGVMTELFTDCQSRLIVGESGQIVHGEGVSCDGGSSIVVDGQRIQTSSGFGLPEDAFDAHPPQFMLGKTVVVTAARSPFGGHLWLNCAACGVTLGR